MSKVLLSHTIKSKENMEDKKDIKGFIKDNVLTYKYDDNKIVLDLSNNDCISFKKEDKDSILNITFDINTFKKSEYIFTDINKKLIINCITKKIIKKEKYMHIEYDLYISGEYSDSFTYELEWRDL